MKDASLSGREKLNNNCNCMKKIILSALLFTSIFLYANFAQAHPGRTDASGCHTCRTNCASWGLSTGEYHCHNAKAVAQPIEPVKSHYGDSGTGYTTPAPEYKTPVSVPVTNIAQPVVKEKIEEQPKAEPVKVQEEKIIETPMAVAQEKEIAENTPELTKGTNSEKTFFQTIFSPISAVYDFIKNLF